MCLSFPRKNSRLTERKTNTFPTSGLRALSCWPYRASAFLPAFLPPFPKDARSQNYRAFLNWQCFPERINQTLNAGAICPDPQRISEATPGGCLNKGGIASMASSTTPSTVWGLTGPCGLTAESAGLNWTASRSLEPTPGCGTPGL